MNRFQAQTTKLAAALMLAGTAIFANAQTTTDTTAQATQQTANPAIDALKKQTEANPQDTQALVKLATAYQEAQNWDAALGVWNKVTGLLPDWAPGYYSQAYVYQSMKENDKAAAAYTKYIGMVKPAEIEANKKNLAYAYLFKAFTEQQSNKELAKQDVAKSLEYDATNQDALKLSEALKQ